MPWGMAGWFTFVSLQESSCARSSVAWSLRWPRPASRSIREPPGRIAWRTAKSGTWAKCAIAACSTGPEASNRTNACSSRSRTGGCASPPVLEGAGAMMRNASLGILLLLGPALLPHPGALPADSWGVAPQIQQAWDGDSLVEGPFLSDRVVVRREGSKDLSIKAPSGSSGLTHRNGRSVALRLFDGKLLLSMKDLETGWRDYDTSLNQPSESGGLQGIPISLHATAKGDRFLATNFTLGFRQGGKASALSWWRLAAGGTLEPEGIIALERDGPVFLATPEQALGPCMDLAPRQGDLLPFLEFPLRVPGGFVVVSLGSGVLWTIREDNQRVHRVIPLRASSLSGLAARPEGGRTLHAIQPTREGKLLAALRGGKLPETAGERREAVLWREVDPMEGTVLEPGPEALKGLPHSLPAGGSLTFRFDPVGRVKVSADR